MKTTEEAPIVYMLTYKQTDYIGLPVWFGVVSLFFLCKIQGSPNILESDAPL